ncbi:MAG TPA: hypothetical protein VLH61_10605 [Bacteroidales bacterium]|nr:hypothetical protein [Bacteroidales bacterium]
MTKNFKNLFVGFVAVFITGSVIAVQPVINFDRNSDQRGINVFEPTKLDTVEFKGLQVRVGGSFTQSFQAIEHSNTATPVMATFGGNQVNLNELFPLGSGFNLANANLNVDIQIADGISVKMENYMSSRHHQNFWVKGGYIQIDKLPFLGNPQWFADHFRVRIGHFGLNYGDQQFRRSDNGNTFFNPFSENLIMDAFTTEIGGEVYFFPTEDLFVMAGVTNGLIQGDVQEYPGIKKNPAILGKVGYDNQLNEDLRLRLSASLYHNSSAIRSTLYAGDRAGSRYLFVGEPVFFRDMRAGGAVTRSLATNRFTSGRLSPDFTNQITTIMINPFVKFRGFEFMGTVEIASGKLNAETEYRKATQLAGEVIYRFLPNESAFIAGRYNVVDANIGGVNADVSIDRIQLAAGWFPTRNLLVKLEYVSQNHDGFVDTDVRHGMKFNGFMLEAAVSF